MANAFVTAFGYKIFYASGEEQFFIPIAGDATLYIHNDPKKDKGNRVTTGTITLNNTIILDADELNETINILEKPIFLQQGENQFKLELNDAPDNSILIAIKIPTNILTVLSETELIIYDGEPLDITAKLTALGIPDPNSEINFKITGLGDIHPVSVKTDENGIATTTLSGLFPMLELGKLTITSHSVSDPVSAFVGLQVIKSSIESGASASMTGILKRKSQLIEDTIPKSAIELIPNISKGDTKNIIIKQGSEHYIGFSLILSQNDNKTSLITFKQTVIPEIGAIKFLHNFPDNGWEFTGNTNSLIGESIDTFIPGTYKVITTATIMETGESDTKELTIRVVKPDWEGDLSIISPSINPRVINTNTANVEIKFGILVNGIENPPDELTLQEVDKNGVVIKTLGKLKQNENSYYLGKFMVNVDSEGTKLYRLTNFYHGKNIYSNTGILTITRFPIGTIKSNPDKFVMGEKDNEFLYSDELFIDFKEAVSPDRIEEIVATEQAIIVGSKEFLGKNTFQLHILNDGTVQMVWDIIAAFKRYPEVEFVQPIKVTTPSLFLHDLDRYSIYTLKIEPKTGTLYTVADSGYGDINKAYSYFCIVNTHTGELIKLAEVNFSEMSQLSFHPDGSLWDWRHNIGLFKINIPMDYSKVENLTLYPNGVLWGKIEGKLTKIESPTSELFMPIPKNTYYLSSMTWNKSGSHLFGVMGTSLWAYYNQNASKICDFAKYTSYLEILSNDTFSIEHNGKKILLDFDSININTCEIEFPIKPSIRLQQRHDTLVITKGKSHKTIFAITLNNLEKIPYANKRINFQQTISPNNDGIKIINESIRLHVYRSGTTNIEGMIYGLKLGSYIITTTVTLEDTGESNSQKLTIEVVKPD